MELEQIKENYKRLVAEGKTDERISDKVFLISDGPMVSYDGKEYDVQGDKRSRLIERIKKAIKVKKLPQPDFTEVVCECGTHFNRSKFSPKQDKCPKCRGTKKAPIEPIDKVCDVCGQTFTVSKFNHYLTTCKSCKKDARNESAKRLRKATKESK